MRSGNSRTDDIEFWEPELKKTKSLSTGKKKTPKKNIEVDELRQYIRTYFSHLGKFGYDMTDQDLFDFAGFISIIDGFPKLQRRIRGTIQVYDELRKAGNSDFPPSFNRKMKVLKYCHRKMKEVDAEERKE